jgi:signal transduction histidine kinase
MADGLPESACATVMIAPNGKVIVRHSTTASLSELDGYNVGVQSAPPGRGRIYESPGGQLWTVNSEGLQEYRNGAWMAHPLPEIAAEYRAGGSRIMDLVPLYPVRQGLVLIALTDSLIEYNADTPEQPRRTVLRAASQSKIGRFTGMISARDGGLWLSGAHGLAKAPSPARVLGPDTAWQEFLPPDSLVIENLREPHEDADGVVTLVAESSSSHQSVIAHFDGEHWTTTAVGDEKLRQAWRGPEHTVWAITATSLLQVDDGAALSGNDDIAARQYFDVAVEPGGNFWLATSDGLFHYSALTWRTPSSTKNIASLVHCLADDKNGTFWFLTGNAMHSLQNEKRQDFPFPDDLARRLPAARALFPLKDGTLLLDAGEECFKFHTHTGIGAFTPVSTKERTSSIRPLGLLRDGNLCLQIAASNAMARLQIYDGVQFEALPDAPRTNLNYTVALAAQNGDLWLGGDQGVSWRHDKRWKAFVTTDKSAPVGATCFAEMADGKIWCAGQDRIWEFDGRSWSGIRQGFDRINGMLRSRDGSVWVASNSGLYRFYQNAWVENGMEDGLPSAAVREIYEDERGVWAGTTHGLSLYHADADPDPPQTRLQEFNEAEKSIPEGGSITVTFSGQDKWKFTPRSRLVYSGRLDERDWSPFQEVNGITLSDQPAGKHVFQVRAMDRNCRLEPDPARLEFVVIVPWYKESRLLLISFAGGAVALFFAGLAVNRHRRLVRSYAEVEQKVADRTRELEIANRELMHSQKMTALGTLAAGIAHDFNNILSIIKGSAQIIEDNLDNPAKVTTRVERIKTVVEQGAGIVKAMLGFSRDSDSQIAPCDLNEVARDTIKLLGDRFLREVQVTFEPTPNLPSAPGSKDFIQQILLNFIFNAAEAMAKRRQVILATQRLDSLPNGMVLAPAQVGEYVVISVHDFGCGITPENMPRIFEPFFTTKALSVRRGTGLGLSMVYELAKKMEAGLAVESVVDQGSAFTLILAVREIVV